MKIKRMISALFVAVMILSAAPLTGEIKASAANYPVISALKISRIYQSDDSAASGMCYWCSMATVQGYCLGTYTYGGLTNNYRTPGTDYKYISAKDVPSRDAVSNKIRTYNGMANDANNLKSFPVKMTLVTGCGNNNSTYEKIYNQLKIGKPVIVYKTGGTTAHASVVIGYNGSTSSLQASGFTVLEVRKNGSWWSNSSSYYNSYANKPQTDSASGSFMSCYVNLDSWIKYGGGTLKQICYPTNDVSPTTPTTPTSPINFTSVWSDNITKTDAQINANFDLTYITSSGFYIGTSSSSLKKVSKNLSGGSDGAGNFKNIYYKMSKWYGTLSTNTTYYYKLYVIKDGKEYCTDVKSFKTLPATYSVSYNANGGNGAPSSQTKTQGTNLVLSKSVPTRSGYTFVSWNTKVDGTGTSYGAGETYTGNSALTLYAQWKQNHTHSYKTTASLPTCTKQGYTTHSCSCGDSYLDNYVAAKGHTEGDWRVTRQATSTEEGIKTLYCKDCGAAIKTAVIPKTGGDIESVFVADMQLFYKESGKVYSDVNYNGSSVSYYERFESSNPWVATIDNCGNITATGKGSTVITYTVTDMNGNIFKDSCTVTVKFQWWQWIIWIPLLGFLWY